MEFNKRCIYLYQLKNIILVDFGVSTQFDRIIGRRNTFIETSYWFLLFFNQTVSFLQLCFCLEWLQK